MRKPLRVILPLLLFFLQSCREDEYWKDSGDQFGFRLKSTANFGEKLVDESNVLRTKIEADYDFNTLGMYFEYASSMDGVLLLNGEQINAKEEYLLEDFENDFTYIGREAGEHLVETFFWNEKGRVQTEIFRMKYGLSDFGFELVRNLSEQESIYQGQEVSYDVYIKPLGNLGLSPQMDYQIAFTKFNRDIEISLDDKPIEKDEFYKISDINSSLLKLRSVLPGKKKIRGIIKNKLVEKKFELDFVVASLSVDIGELSLGSEYGEPGDKFTLSSSVKKLPILFNTKVQYRTWVSEFPKGGKNGIITSQGHYVSYDLGSNYQFSGKLEVARDAPWGKYTVSIQFRDEFGNESKVESFDFSVEQGITFSEEPTGIMSFGMYADRHLAVFLYTYNYGYKYSGVYMNYVLKRGRGVEVRKIEFICSFSTRTVGDKVFRRVIDDPIEIKREYLCPLEHYIEFDSEYCTKHGDKEEMNYYSYLAKDYDAIFSNRQIVMKIYTDDGRLYEKKFSGIELGSKQVDVKVGHY